MATAKLIGADDTTGSNTNAGYFRLNRFQALVTGNQTEFRVKSGVDGYVKCAIYADDNGEPGALIGAMDTGQAVTAGQWNTLTFTSPYLTAGTYYWLAVCFDVFGAIQHRVTTGIQHRYKAATYSTFTFPDPAGSGFGTSTTVECLLAGWGLLVVSPTSIVQPIVIGEPAVTQQQLFESYLEENAYYNVYGAYWRCQTFTPQSTHKITSVRLKLCRVGSPGTGTVSIKATDANGKPTGADLCSASIDGDSLPTDPTLLGFSLGAGYTLNVGTKYAIVWRFPSGDASNYARTRHMYPGAYTGGTAVTSGDGGAT